MGIVTIVNDNVNLLEGLNFCHGERQFQNLVADSAVFPMAFLDEPITSNDNILSSGYIEETYPLNILVANKSELDYTPAQHNTIVEAMRELSKKLIVRLGNDSRITEVKNVKRTNVINLFDANITGVYMSLTLTLSVEGTNNSIC